MGPSPHLVIFSSQRLFRRILSIIPPNSTPVATVPAICSAVPIPVSRRPVLLTHPPDDQRPGPGPGGDPRAHRGLAAPWTGRHRDLITYIVAP
jgi:hypothetical protein